MAPRRRLGKTFLAAALLVPVLPSILTGAARSADGAPSASPLLAAADGGTAAHMAFTDDRDELVELRSDTGEAVRVGDADVRHAGEASGTYVSSSSASVFENRYFQAWVEAGRPGDNGQVVALVPASDVPDLTFEVTCDDSVKTHPVWSPDGLRIAYASDLDSPDGHFSIYVVRVFASVEERQNLLAEGTPPRCMTPQPVTTGASEGFDDLWPAWGRDLDQSSQVQGAHELIFSSTRDDRMGDLYRVCPEECITPDEEVGRTVRLLDNPGYADTQPTYVQLPVHDVSGDHTLDYVVYTTTTYRRDGSLAYVDLESGSWLSVWDNGEMIQSSEPAANRIGELLFTTTETDPYGDIRMVQLFVFDFSRDAHGRYPGFEVAARPGRAEGHGGWAQHLYTFSGCEFGCSDTSSILFTRHAHDADVSDVLAAEGTGRRDLTAASATDDSAPSYAPDGARIAFSQATAAGSRTLVIANADGTGASPLAAGRVDHEACGDIDLDPVWSGDGTQLAFSRWRPADDSCEVFSPPQVWVVAADGSNPRSVSAPVEDGVPQYDEAPSWSPDGTKLVIARTLLQPADVSVEVTPERPVLDVDDVTAVRLRVHNDGPGTAYETRVTFTVPDAVAIAGIDKSEGNCVQTATREVVCEFGMLRANSDFTSAVPFPSQRFAWVRVRPTVAGSHLITGSVVSQPGDPELSNNTDTAVLSAGVEVDIAAMVQAPQTLQVGATDTVTFGASNPSDIDAYGINIQFRRSGAVGFPAGTPAPAGCINDGVGLSCNNVMVPANGTREFTTTIEGLFDGFGEVRVTASTPFTDPNPANNTATATVTVGEPPVILFASQSPILRLTAIGSRGGGDVPAPPRLAMAGTPMRGAPLPRPVAVESQLWVIEVPAVGTAPTAGQQLSAQLCSTSCRTEPLFGRSPAWSPVDEAVIAFELHGQMVLATLDGSVATLSAVTGVEFSDPSVFDNEGSPTESGPLLWAAWDPAWSPDGARLAFAGSPIGQPDQRGIWVTDADESGLTPLPGAQSRVPESEPAWQPSTDLGVSLAGPTEEVAVATTTTVTATVVNNGPGRGTGTLTVTLPPGLTPDGALPTGCSAPSGGVMTCTVTLLAPGGSLAFAFGLTVVDAGTHPVAAMISTAAPDPNPGNNADETTVTGALGHLTLVPPALVFPEQLGLSPSSPQTVTVTNVGNIPVTINGLALENDPFGDFTVTPSSSCVGSPLAPGATCQVSVTITPQAPGPRAATLRVDHSGAGSPQRLPLSGVGSTPTILTNPGVGVAGTVTGALGEKFPPNQTISMVWVEEGSLLLGGFPEPVVTATSNADGTLTADVVVFPSSRLGARVLLAAVGSFSTNTPFLVVRGTAQAPDFVSRR